MRLTIIGASGHGRVIADIARLNGYDDIVFLDDNPDVTECAGFPVLGGTKTPIEGDAFVAIGNATIRRRLSEGLEPVTLVHPDAVVAQDVVIGKGTVVMAGAVINPGTTIGDGCIVNTCASVDHDCVVADFVHVSVGARLCGTVTVGGGAWVGAGAVISNNLTICANVIMGAGAVVVKDIKESGTYVGLPARKMVASK